MKFYMFLIDNNINTRLVHSLKQNLHVGWATASVLVFIVYAQCQLQCCLNVKAYSLD